MQQTGAPNPDELEVSVFGPGYGECILLHVGLGDWIIVDCCVDKVTGQAPVLDYLRRIGVDPSTSVKLVAATHWHDDHVRGLSSVLEACSQAVFACSSMMREREVMYAFQLPDNAGVMGAGMRQLRQTFEIVKKRHETPDEAATPMVAFRWAEAQKTLWRRRTEPEAVVRALTPSDWSRLKAVEHFRTYVKQGDRAKRIWPYPNHAAVALWVTVGDVAVLLGSDLEVEPDQRGGWKGVFVDPLVTPDERAELVKVPHHGSPDAHFADMWDQLLIRGPWAVLCPWQRGGRVRPQPEDIARICAKCRAVWMTAPAEPPPPSPPDYAQSAIGSDEMREMETASGRVTLRRGLTGLGTWRCDLEPPAFCACDNVAAYA